MKRIISLSLILMLMAWMCTACSVEDNQETGKSKIVTTNFAEYDWVRNITGSTEKFEITMLGGGVDMHSYQPTATDIMTEEQCRVEELLKRLYFVFENADKPLSHICSGISDIEIMSNILTFDTRLYDVNADTCLKAFEDALESGNKCFFNAVFEYRKDVKFIRFLEFYGLRIGLPGLGVEESGG